MAYAQTLSIPMPSSARPASGRRPYASNEPAPTALIPRIWKNFTGAGTFSTLRSRRKMLRRQRYSMPQMFRLKQPVVCCQSMEGYAKHSRAKNVVVLQEVKGDFVMSKHVPTLTDYLLQEEQKAKSVSSNFPLLLIQIENAAKVIASQLRIAGLIDLLGKTGGVNTFGDEVQKLDAFANQLLVDSLIASGTVHAVASEE